MCNNTRRITVTKSRKPKPQKPSQKIIVYKSTKKIDEQAERKRLKKKSSGLRKPRTLVSACAARYGVAIVNPFDTAADGLCLPVEPAIKSQKLARILRGTFVVGSQGVGFVAMNPSLANDAPCVYSTTASYGGTGLMVTPTATTLQPGVLATSVPGTWSASELSQQLGPNTVAGRVVVAGMQAQYSGKLLDRAGNIQAICEPNHDSLCGVNAQTSTEVLGAYKGIYDETNLGQLVTLSGTTEYSCEEEYQQPKVVMNGIGAATVTMQNCIFPWLTQNLTGGDYVQPNMAIIVAGATPGSSFKFAIVIHSEYSGRATAGAATPSEADPIGFAAVNSAAKELPEAISASKSFTMDKAIDLFDNLVNKALRVSRGVATVATMASRAFPPRARTRLESIMN